jgi:hypothetical protein
METAGKVLLVSAVVLAIVGMGALGLAKVGVDRVPGTLSWKSDNVYLRLREAFLRSARDRRRTHRQAWRRRGTWMGSHSRMSNPLNSPRPRDATTDPNSFEPSTAHLTSLGYAQSA